MKGNKRFFNVLFFVSLSSFIAYLQFEGLDLIDESTYASLVDYFHKSGFWVEQQSHFSNRIGMLFPVVALTKVLGESAIAFVLFSFVCYLLLVLLVQNQYGFTAALWLALNPVVSKLAVKLLPDVPMLFFFGIAAILLLRMFEENGFNKINLFALSVFIVWGCYCKETMLLFVFPLLAVSLLLPVALRKKVFFTVAISALLGFVLLLLNGQFSQATQHILSNQFFNFSGAALAKRLFIDPLIFVTSNAGYSLVFIPALVAFFQPIRENKFFVLKLFWLTTVLVSFYSTVSFTHYIPLQLIYRYHLPVIFGSVLLSSQLFVFSKKLILKTLYNTLAAALILVLVAFALQSIFYSGNLMNFGFAIAEIGLLFLIFYFINQTNYIALPTSSIYVVYYLIAFPIIKQEHYAVKYFEEKEVIERYLMNKSEKRIAFGNGQNTNNYSIYFGFNFSEFYVTPIYYYNLEAGDFLLLNRQHLNKQKLGGQEVYPFKLETQPTEEDIITFLKQNHILFDTLYTSKDILLLKVK
jgi:hypothetical protein